LIDSTTRFLKLLNKDETAIKVLEKLAKIQSSTEDWKEAENWIREHCPNAEDGERILKILMDRIEELEGQVDWGI
jgi:lipopolysaccharide biosynthesis regulator YciM